MSERKDRMRLDSLRRRLDKPYYFGYLAAVTTVFILTRFASEVSSNLNTYIQSSVVTEFFLKDNLSYEDALAKYTLMSIMISSVTMLSVFYKVLADKWGRKPVLMLNAVGLAVGMLLCYSSTNVYVYFAGVVCYMFFIQNDLQMVYILETAPHGKGARFFGLIKSFGILGLVLIPILRDFFMGDDAGRWREVFFVPMLLCLAVAVSMALGLRETKPYLSRRIEELEGSGTVSEDKPKQKKGGIGAAIRYILSHKYLRWLIITYMLYAVCSLSAYTYIESIMTTSGMATRDVTKALYIYPFVYAAISLISGFVADKLGRKYVVVGTGFTSVVCFVLFIIACRAGWNPYLVGFLNGLYLGSFWMCGDYMLVSVLELTPTEIRASITGAASILMAAGCAVGITIQLILMTTLDNIALTCLIMIVPALSIGTLIFMLKARETKGTVMELVGREEDE